ncbi:cupin domain-containing protein [Pelagibacterales bacterium SAG-MED31]|nr:cupin domain-containing protein [Pelagibacterales bacterium SAG-MED31]
MNTSSQKNELIFGYSSGSLGEAKSLLVSTYLYLNTFASKKASIFNNILAENFANIKDVAPKKINFKDCFYTTKASIKESSTLTNSEINPLTNIIGSFDKINWKSVFKGFKEFTLPLNDDDTIKLIKMDPGTSVPLHSHNGKEYILVVDGSFYDEHGEYKKGDLQINDQRIKHHPTACDKDGCICLSITENEVVFFGKFASLLNLVTFVKSFFK